MLKRVLTAAAAGAMLLLAACNVPSDLTSPNNEAKAAYTLGESWKVVQEGEKAYLQVGKPSPAKAEAIEDANAKASAMVTAVLNHAADRLDKQEQDPAAVDLGLTPEQEKEAKASAFQELVGIAQAAIASVKKLLR